MSRRSTLASRTGRDAEAELLSAQVAQGDFVIATRRSVARACEQ
ncbi:MAG: hypothetical protein R3C97_07405 [Geminicoccaceae bacterium]